MEVLVIDTSIVLYKISHSISKQVKINGVMHDVSPLIGLPKIIKNTGYDIIYFVLDGYPKAHKELYPPYKGDRNYEFSGVHSIPLSTQISFLYSTAKLNNIDIRFLATPNNEADQVISSYLYAYHKPHLRAFQTTENPNEDKWLASFDFHSYKHVTFQDKIDKFVVLTTDSDVYQVQTLGNIHISNDIRGSQTSKGYTPVAVSGVNPATIAVYKALIGDASDNIPNTIKRSAANERVISDVLDTDTAVEDFIRSLQSKKPLPIPSLKPIYDDLKLNGNLKQFFINYRLTKLGFTSLPYQVTPQLVDVFEIRAKYGLR